MQRRAFRVGKNGKGTPGIPVDPAKLRQARQDAKLSLGELAVGFITKQHVSALEHGRWHPSLEVLLHISRMTKKPLDFFVISAEDAKRLRTQLAECFQDGKTDRRMGRTVPEQVSALAGRLRIEARKTLLDQDRAVYLTAATTLAAFAPLLAEIESRNRMR